MIPDEAEPPQTIEPVVLRPLRGRRSAAVFLAGLLFASIIACAAAQAQEAARSAQKRPNIVLMFPDNLGIGEVSSYGGVRGVPTPNIDRIAEEGIRLTNFNVEYSCIVSRIALLTGRYAVRTGDGLRGGMTLWEVTIAEALRTIGYATALFGKWDVGGDDWEGRRDPLHQGFDEWWGIPGTSNPAQFSSFEGFDPTRTELPYIWEGRGDGPSRRVKPFDLEARRTIDREAAQRGIAFMERNVEAGRPFFFFYPMTQIHFPHYRIRTSPARPEPATSATPWRTSTTT